MSVFRVNQRDIALHLVRLPFISTGGRGWPRRMDACAAQVPGRFRRDQDVAADQPEIPNVCQPLAVLHVYRYIFVRAELWERP